MSGRKTRSSIVMGAAVVFGASFAVAQGGAPARGAGAVDDAAAASAVVSSVLPGSSSVLAPGGAGGGVDLEISVPEATAVLPGTDDPALSAPAPPSDEGTDIGVGELGWKAAVAAGLAGRYDTNIVGYQIAEDGYAFTPLQQNYVSGELRARPGDSEYNTLAAIGTVPEQTLMEQLTSNLDVLGSALPPGSILGSEISEIPVDSSAGDYAFEIDLKVSDLGALQDYEGDIISGLGTGVVGAPNAPSEGLAINVVDTQGRRASWWSAARAGSGSGLADPALSMTGGVETVVFPDITGGPSPTSSASSGIVSGNGE
jgi:hypothetical protein